MNEKLKEQFQNMQPSAMLKMFNASLKYDNLINLGVGEPDLDSPQEVIDATVTAVKGGFTHYPPMIGYPDLRNEICAYWKKHHEVEMSPEEIIVTIGGSQALYSVMQAYIGEGDEVLVTDPCFPSYLNQIKYVNGTAVQVPVYEKDGFCMKAETLEKYITDKSKLIILNYPSNPTGAVIDRDELEKIAKIVLEHDLIVISDEIYEAFIFEGQHIPFATIEGMKERTFTVAGFSKTYAMTGYRVGYVVTDKKNINVLAAIETDTIMGVNSFAQKGCLAALKDCDYFVEKMVALYKSRIEHTVKLINSIDTLSCNKPKGSFYIMMNISKTGMKSEEFALKILEEARVVVMPGSSFGKNADDFVRISCNGSFEKLDEAFGRIKNALNGIKFQD